MFQTKASDANDIYLPSDNYILFDDNPPSEEGMMKNGFNNW
jgi:hypothetical protein